jgi:putative phosphoribosyl transferase
MIPRRKWETNETEREVFLDLSEATLEGTLAFPKDPAGIVLFAHGSGSSRRSPRNRYVAEVLHSKNIATLLFDLLTRQEEVVDAQTAELRFDIPLLARRLQGVTLSVLRDPGTKLLPLGYFGASTGAAAALLAAAREPEVVAAVVSRGGRPDLAPTALGLVQAPTLLIVGGEDKAVIDMNRRALAEIGSPMKKLVIVPGATHLFEEPGKLEEVARLAANWFARYLVPPAQSRISGHG